MGNYLDSLQKQENAQKQAAEAEERAKNEKEQKEKAQKQAAEAQKKAAEALRKNAELRAQMEKLLKKNAGQNGKKKRGGRDIEDESEVDKGVTEEGDKKEQLKKEQEREEGEREEEEQEEEEKEEEEREEGEREEEEQEEEEKEEEEQEEEEKEEEEREEGEREEEEREEGETEEEEQEEEEKEEEEREEEEREEGETEEEEQEEEEKEVRKKEEEKKEALNADKLPHTLPPSTTTPTPTPTSLPSLQCIYCHKPFKSLQAKTDHERVCPHRPLSPQAKAQKQRGQSSKQIQRTDGGVISRADAMTFIRNQLQRAGLKFVNGYMDFFKRFDKQQLMPLQQNPGDIWRHVLAVLDTILDYAIQKQPSVLPMQAVNDASVIATHLTSLAPTLSLDEIPIPEQFFSLIINNLTPYSNRDGDGSVTRAIFHCCCARLSLFSRSVSISPRSSESLLDITPPLQRALDYLDRHPSLDPRTHLSLTTVNTLSHFLSQTNTPHIRLLERLTQLQRKMETQEHSSQSSHPLPNHSTPSAPSPSLQCTYCRKTLKSLQAKADHENDCPRRPSQIKKQEDEGRRETETEAETRKREQHYTRNEGGSGVLDESVHRLSLQSITSLDAAAVSFSESDRMKREGNTLTHPGPAQWRSGFIGGVLTSV